MKPTLSRTLSHTAVYAIGVGVQNITSLVMLPIYTRFLMPADYGTVEILNMVLDVTLLIFGLRVDQGLFRYYHAYAGDQQQQNAVVSTVLFLTLALNALGALFLVALSPQVALAFLGERSLWSYLAIYSVCLLAPALLGVPLSYTRLRGRPGFFLVLSITKLFVQVALNILFVVVLHLKVIGVIYSTITTQVLMGTVLTLFTLRRVGWQFSPAIRSRLITFSLPLVVSGFASFYMIFADRWFLRRSWGLAAVGIYGLAYRFGFAFYTVTYEPFRRAWDGQKYEIHAYPNATESYRTIFGLIVKGLVLAGLIVSVFIQDFLHVFVGANYWSAAGLVPILIAAFVVRPLTDFCNLGLLVTEQTRHLAYASWLAAGVMTVGYLFAVPRFGPMGAAATTLIGFATELYWINRSATRCYDMNLPWARAFLAAGITVAAFLAAALVEVGTVGSFLLRAMIVLAAAGTLYLSPATTDRERGILVRYCRAARLRIATWLRRRTAGRLEP